MLETLREMVPDLFGHPGFTILFTAGAVGFLAFAVWLIREVRRLRHDRALERTRSHWREYQDQWSRRYT